MSQRRSASRSQPRRSSPWSDRGRPRETPSGSACSRHRGADGKCRVTSSGGGLQGDVVSEAFELGDEPAGGAFGVAAAEVVAAEVVVQLTGREHVPAGTEDRVFDGAERAAMAAPRPQPLVLGGEVDVVGAGGSHRRLGEGGVEPLGAVAGFAGAALAGGAVA